MNISLLAEYLFEDPLDDCVEGTFCKHLAIETLAPKVRIEYYRDNESILIHLFPALFQAPQNLVAYPIVQGRVCIDAI